MGKYPFQSRILGEIGGADSGDTIKYGDSYDIKIVNTPKSYTVILNDKEIASVEDTSQDGVGRIGLALGAPLPNMTKSSYMVQTAPNWLALKEKYQQHGLILNPT